MKKVLSILLIIALAVSIAACSKDGGDKTADNSPANSPDTSPSETASGQPPSETAPDTNPDDGSGDVISPEPDVSNARIVMGTQEYIGENIAEIPYFEYDGDMNPELDSLNRLLNQGIGQIYYNFMDTGDADRWIEIRAYPFTSEDYLQVVVTHIDYPNYGTDGDIFSVNYDRVRDCAVNVEDAFNELGITDEIIQSDIERLYVPEHDGQYVGNVATKGFLYCQRPDGGYFIELLLEVTIENDDSDPWTYFFSYTPEFDEITMLSNICLFDPYNMDQMDPPLSYQQ